MLAHETGHIAGGHLARMGQELDRAKHDGDHRHAARRCRRWPAALQPADGEALRAGQGIMGGSGTWRQRYVSTTQRAMESSADQAALKFLNATGQSARGMLTLFQKLANQSIASVQYRRSLCAVASDAVRAHPQSRESQPRAAPISIRRTRPNLMLRHQLMQAKLTGFLTPQQVYQRYPTSDMSMPARYARAIVMFRSGDTTNAMPVIDSLIAGSARRTPISGNSRGRPCSKAGVRPRRLRRSGKPMKLLPSNGLIKIMLAQALIGTETPENAQAAIKLCAKRPRPKTTCLRSIS